MPLWRDIASNNISALILATPITSNGDSFSAPFAVPEAYSGVVFTVGIADYTDGDYEFFVQESEDGSNWSDVPAKKIFNVFDPINPEVNAYPVALSMQSPFGIQANIGVISVEKNLRIRVNAANVTSGATPTATANAQIEYQDTASYVASGALV